MILQFDSTKMKAAAEEMLAVGTARHQKELQNPSERTRTLQETCSLEKWLRRANEACISSIPAQFSDPILTHEIWASLDNEAGPFPSLKTATLWLKQHLISDTMWRWDCCAPYLIKSCMGDGVKPTPTTELDLDDPRFVDILYELFVPKIKICVRPWVQAMMVEYFPVEFRVFHLDHDQVAVSSYYPQRDLGDEFLVIAKHCGELTKRLAQSCPRQQFTADFLITDKQDILFLEGGPAWGMGAHPCCFNPSQILPGRIVLRKEDGNVID